MVYVDDLVCVGRRAPACFRNFACHMMADTDAELEAMARQLGLRRNWRQSDHYDLSRNKRRSAVTAGAIEVSALDLVRLRQWKRNEIAAEQAGKGEK